jgi:hypothetical protein
MLPKLITALVEAPVVGGPEGLARGGGVLLSKPCGWVDWAGRPWYGARWLGLLLEEGERLGTLSSGNVLGGGSRML